MRTLFTEKSNKTKGIKKVFMITICWVLIQSIIYFQEYYATMELIQMEKLIVTYEFWPGYFNNLFFSIFGGVIGGSILVLKIPDSLSQNALLSEAISSGLLFILCYLVLAMVGLFGTGFVYFASLGNLLPALNKTIENLALTLITPSFFASLLIWGLLVSATQFVLQISAKFGEKVFWKLITGQYNRPKEEERIFMFLDLKGATSIAEKMESGRFFEMLKEIYKDITVPITESAGEIYQYVGDEVVISWPVDKGIKNNNALVCFFRIEKEIAEQKSKYLSTYGVVPTFKAGLHIGKATIGEIGVVKKEIVYSGDVLNTTSRIQALCNFYEVHILISSALLQLMELGAKYVSDPIGEIGLRGKEHKIALNTVRAL